MLAELLAGVRGTLGPQLVGVYLDGSLATGDFAQHSSDIDVLVVTEGVLADEVIAALERCTRGSRRERRSGRESSRSRTSTACASPLQSRRQLPSLYPARQ